MANTSRIHCVREAYDGEHKTLIVKLGKGSRQHAFGRDHNYQSFRRDAPQYVRSRKGFPFRLALAKLYFSGREKVAQIQPDGAYHLMCAAPHKAVQHQQATVQFAESEGRVVIVMGRATGNPASSACAPYLF
jgi:hypothetical protein